jgi:hypothetical protein
VLVEWLKAKHLLRVGSAFCCRALRSLAFLTTTARTTLDLSSPVFNPMLKWAISRGAQVEGLGMSGSFT